MRKHILSIVVQNQPGVLAHIAGMFAARGYNIDSLVVGRTEDPGLSHMVIVSLGDDATLEQIRKQLGKIVPVVKVRDLTEQQCVQRDLMLTRVHCPPEKRVELRQITEVFRGNIVDVGPRSVVVQLTGTEEKVEAFIDLVRPYGIKQLSRTGLIAMSRDLQQPETEQAPRKAKRLVRGMAAATTAEEDAVILPPS